MSSKVDSLRLPVVAELGCRLDADKKKREVEALWEPPYRNGSSLMLTIELDGMLELNTFSKPLHGCSCFCCAASHSVH